MPFLHITVTYVQSFAMKYINDLQEYERQAGIPVQKIWARLGNNFHCEFLFYVLIYVLKEFRSYLHWFLRNCCSKLLQRNLKEI